MKWLLNLFKRRERSESVRIVAESPPTTLSTWMSLMDSEVLSGPQSHLCKRVQSSTQFMDSLQGLILAKAQTELREAEARSSSAMAQLLPHMKYSARLFHDGITWICTWGTDPNSQVVGRGDCPQEALNAFDMAWHGTTKEEWEGTDEDGG